MIQYAFLDKSQKDMWLPKLFDLYYENMHVIAPSGLGYAQEWQMWLDAVSPALEKAPRKILLCTGENGLLGYIQFYTRNDLLMIEEVQIAKAYQRTLLFANLCRCLKDTLPEEIRYVEAYADERNVNSRKLMEKLGMNLLEEEGQFVHLRGDFDRISQRLCR